MKLAPHIELASWEISSSIQLDQLVNGMTRRIEQGALRWPFHRDYKALRGSINTTGFTLNCNRPHMSYLMKGTFILKETGTNILVKVTLNPFLVVFMTCWFGFLAAFALRPSVVWVTTGQWTFHPVEVALFLFGVLVLTIKVLGYWTERDELKVCLNQIIYEINKEVANQVIHAVGAKAPQHDG